MAEKHLINNDAQEENFKNKKERVNKQFQTITLAVLPFLWVGYFYSLYSGSESSVLTYMGAILAISVLNADVLFKCEKTQYKILNILAKIESILLVVSALITIVMTIVK